MTDEPSKLKIVDVVSDILPSRGKAPRRGSTFRAPRLFKYVAFDRLEQILGNLSIRMTQPRYLNDPHELGFVIKGESLQRDFYAYLIAKGMDPETAADLAKRETLDMGVERVKDIKTQREELGVLSLSTTPDNLLMWSHYGNQHKGAVIELDVDPLIVQKENPSHIQALFEVEYQDKRVDFIERQVPLWLTLAFKSKAWAYEQEWRLVRSLNMLRKHDDIVYLLPLPPQSIRRIYFGAEADEALEEKVYTETQANEDLRHVQFEKMWFSSSFTKVNHCTLQEFADKMLHGLHHFGGDWRQVRQWLDLESFERAENVSPATLKAKASAMNRKQRRDAERKLNSKV